MIKPENVTNDCFANQKLVLNCFGLLHNQNVLRQVHPIGLLFLITIYLVTVFPEILKEYYVDLQKFIFSLAVEIGLLIILMCMYITFWKRFKFKQLIEKLQLLDELSNFKNGNGENAFVQQYKDIVRKQVYLGFLWITFFLISLISMSVILSFNEEKWILPFGSGSAIIHNENIQFIIQILIFGILAIVFHLLLIIYINVSTLICGHCKLLQIYIALSFTDYQGEIYKKLDIKHIEKKIPDWESFKVQLQHFVPYHIGIIDVANQMETVFSGLVLILFGAVSIALCLVIYHTQLNIGILDTVKDLIIIIGGYSLLCIISSYGEEVATESVKIGSTCYELDIVGCDLRIQKSLILEIAISQRPIILTIGKIRVLGLPIMISVMQSIYSYYTILRNVMNN